ncbi:SUKH-3 domain-containing protein [Streptomyces gobiensis]|uniref:SUKH-3 domain-containing protein n=1 Tax=Streptomyces gobiensis TaxID=2875706 RepID=UPI001E650D23|nr:SUKH-3 domain-containing protein [Streptomyces gobiensis]UGY91843.1 SUKH-3 domain-containing protein [Streptomyces gobiensis]
MNSRFPAAVDAALRAAGWQPGRWDIRQAEVWADTLRAHLSPAGHRHMVFPAAVEAWAEFGGLRIAGTGPGRHIAPTPLRIDPERGLHWARTLSDLGRALDTEIAPLGEELRGELHGELRGEPGGEVSEEDDGSALLAIDMEGRVYSLDHSGDWYLGPHIDAALTTLVTGAKPVRLTYGQG